jgi:hypothetical protein
MSMNSISLNPVDGNSSSHHRQRNQQQQQPQLRLKSFKKLRDLGRGAYGICGLYYKVSEQRKD